MLKYYRISKRSHRAAARHHNEILQFFGACIAWTLQGRSALKTIPFPVEIYLINGNPAVPG